jgi:hypothetical protein
MATMKPSGDEVFGDQRLMLSPRSPSHAKKCRMEALSIFAERNQSWQTPKHKP